MKAITQTEAVNHIEKLLIERGFNVPSRQLVNQWMVFEYQGKQIGIDLAARVWVRGSESDDGRCFAAPCTVSGAIQAVEFLAKE
jgi:hypothetical protein